jgi:hypothetical protein
MTREQGTGNREQGTGNREQGTGKTELIPTESCMATPRKLSKIKYYSYRNITVYWSFFHEPLQAQSSQRKRKTQFGLIVLTYLIIQKISI